MAISSTRIRKLLLAGEVKEAGMLLGRPYSLTGKVIKGKERGRSLGFPTANLEILGRRIQLVKEGVYVIQAMLDDKWHNGLISIGVRPTFNETTLEHEVYLLDFSKGPLRRVSKGGLHRTAKGSSDVSKRRGVGGADEGRREESPRNPIGHSLLNYMSLYLRCWSTVHSLSSLFIPTVRKRTGK